MKKLILLILFVFCLSFHASAWNPMIVTNGVDDVGACISEATAIGYDVNGAASAGDMNHDIYCYQFTALCSGDIDEIKIITNWLAADPEFANCAIYSDNADAPGTLLKDGTKVSGTDQAGETITITLDAAQTIIKDTEYWLCVWGDETWYLQEETTGGDHCYDRQVGGTGDAFPANIVCDETGVEKGSVWGVAQ